MSRDIQLKERWEKVVTFLSDKFADGEVLDLDAIIYLIGVQELGKINSEFKKDEKVNLMHIAICKLLEPYGYYEFEFFDKEGWPHYKVIKELPALTSGVQSEIGVNESESFSQQVTEALTSLQAALTQSKGTLQSALNGITGQGGAMAADNAFGDEAPEMSADMDMSADMAAPAGGEDFSVDDDISVEEPEEEVPVTGAGRIKR